MCVYIIYTTRETINIGRVYVYVYDTRNKSTVRACGCTCVYITYTTRETNSARVCVRTTRVANTQPARVYIRMCVYNTYTTRKTNSAHVCVYVRRA